MSSTTSTLSLSWSNSFHNFAGATNEPLKSPEYGRFILPIVAQKKTKKIRKVTQLLSFHFPLIVSYFQFPGQQFLFNLVLLLVLSYKSLLNYVLFVQIILKDDVPDLGKKGQLLDVRAGFYRNFLFPMGKAQIVTPLLIK